MESLLQKFPTNTMENIEKEMKQTNEPLLQSVGLQLQGMNRTIGKMEEDSDDRHSIMNEKITTVEKGMTMLEDPSNRGSEIGTKAQGAESEKSRSDRIPRPHDRTRSTRHTGRNHNYDRNVNGPITDAEERFHQKRFGSSSAAIIQRHNVPLEQIKMNRWTRHVSSTER